MVFGVQTQTLLPGSQTLTITMLPVFDNFFAILFVLVLFVSPLFSLLALLKHSHY